MLQTNPGSNIQPTPDRSGRNLKGHASAKQDKVVSQDLLATLKKRQAEMKEATLLYKKCRQSILDLHDDCAKVEPGRLAFPVTSSKSRRYTIKNLITALGEQGSRRFAGGFPQRRAEL